VSFFCYEVGLRGVGVSIFAMKLMKIRMGLKSIILDRESIMPHSNISMSLNCKDKQGIYNSHNKLSYLSIPCFCPGCCWGGVPL